MSVGQELLNTPFPEMVQKLAISVAEAQTKLDMNSTAVASAMAKEKITLPDLSKPDSGSTSEFSLLAMGFLPTFYAVQEAVIEVKMAITMAKTTEKSGSASAKAGWGPFAASVNASYSSRYNYSQEGSSLLRVKLAPADPPIILQKYMEAVTDQMSAKMTAAIDKANEGKAPPPEK